MSRQIPGMKPVLPEIKWEDNGLRPSDYLETFKGPEIVRLQHADGGPVSLGPLVDPTRPFLVFSHRRRTKAFADPVFEGKEAPPNCPRFEIPKDYVGWFEILSSDGKPIECLPSVGAVAVTGCRYFLLRSMVAGFRVQEEEDGELELLEECKFFPGEVLMVEKVCKKVWKTKDNNKSDESTATADTKFLKCQDLNKNSICLPLAHPGVFSAIGMSDSIDRNAVYQIWNILDRHNFPVTVRLSFGWAPKLKSPDVFSGTLHITESYRPDSLLLYSFSEDGIVLLELPIDAKVRIIRAQDRQDLAKTEAFRYALFSCKKKIFPFAISLKPLDLQYDSEDDDEPLKYMASPRDMQVFSRADVYPPLADEPLPEFWSLSFKDPEFMYETLRVKVQGSGESNDAMTDATLRRLSVSEEMVRKQARSQSVVSQSGYSERSSRRGSSQRAEKYGQVEHREAQC